ncbi:unnamed protein product [Ceutorhynchus assimilis]|uniref:Uncharacterized protein n=1 Tax=Ceutorhynchus assimilis TaxID=467358 RepID=A0A9N9QLZ6_9CUCU|nr:unnamed protein product [Ceutorhynchus assimilis]
MIRSITLVVFLLAYKSFCYQTDYYWKDYTGIIPDDAFIAGHDYNGENIYVGLVYLGAEGIIPATITPGEKNTYAAAGSDSVKSQNYIQILCNQHPGSLKWIPVNKTDFHFITMHKQLVRGGIQNSNWLHIGRINHQGSLIVGKIMSGRAPINDAFMSYVYNEDVKKANSFETLTFVNLEDNELIEPK